MIAETGHFALILALFVAIIQAVIPLIGAQRGDLRQHAGAGVFDAQVLHQSRRKSPEAPPLFSTSRTPSMVMALSAALSMS